MDITNVDLLFTTSSFFKAKKKDIIPKFLEEGISQLVHLTKGRLCLFFISALSSLEDVTDDRLCHELESGRGKHPKWTFLSSDENFCNEIGKFVHEKAFSPNRTLHNVVPGSRTSTPWKYAGQQAVTCYIILISVISNLARESSLPVIPYIIAD